MSSKIYIVIKTDPRYEAGYVTGFSTQIIGIFHNESDAQDACITDTPLLHYNKYDYTIIEWDINDIK